jgi:hypothetical protein
MRIPELLGVAPLDIILLGSYMSPSSVTERTTTSCENMMACMDVASSHISVLLNMNTIADKLPSMARMKELD